MREETIAEVFALSDSRCREEVFVNTWGHLAPKRNKSYEGTIVFAIGCFGDDPLNPTILAADFDGLDSSPWFFDALSALIATDQHCDDDRSRFKVGCVYRWRGTFKNYKFIGTFQPMGLTE